MAELEVYIDKDCFACGRAEAIAREVDERFPAIRITVVNRAVEDGPHAHLVIATPTYVLNGRIFKLGNPTVDELERALSADERRGSR